MGCTYETFKMSVSNHVDVLKQLFMKFFKDDLYWSAEETEEGLLSCEVKPDGSGDLSFEEEPFFNNLMMDDDVFNFFVLFCATYPDVEANYSYRADLDTDSSCTLSRFKYANGVVEGETRYGYAYVECQECGWREFDDEGESAPFSIYDFDPKKKYVCPECEEPLDLSDWKIEKIKENIQDFELTEEDFSEFEV